MKLCPFVDNLLLWNIVREQKNMQKDRKSKGDELPTTCQIQLEGLKGSSRHQSEDSQSRLQAAPACMASCTACDTQLYEHVNQAEANKDTM